MPADRADEFLLCCREMTEREGGSPVCFAPEFVMGLVEINTPAMRDELDYLVQDRTVGPERFVHAGRCAGMHLHLELAEGTVDPSAGIAASVPEGARAEALNLYNLATALDPALISLTADGIVTQIDPVARR